MSAEVLSGAPLVGRTHRVSCSWASSLVGFSPRHTPVYHFDVVVLGGGIAGSVAALSAARLGASVALLAKGELRESNTVYAQGGLAAALVPPDSESVHAADTVHVGCGLCEPGVVQRVVRGAREAVDLLLRLGAEFDRTDTGDLVLSREGGHSYARILHANGDATGQEIQRALAAAVSNHPGVATFPNTHAIDLLTGENGRVGGVLAMTPRGDVVTFSAGQVILATGGSGQIFRETTNPAIATGDGIAMGLRVGATVRDLEFVQFHPTCLYIAGAARVLISEIVRGAGGVLRDRQGTRFMPEFHPDAELAPRDVVSRAVFSVMVSTGDTNVYLDLSDVDGDPHVLFPGISRICRFFGIDIAKDPVPVRPGAHYQVGGLLVDSEGRTSVPGLWAVGECASSGLHGANRMGSNSLLEGAVLGAACGHAAAAERTHPEAPSWTARKQRVLPKPPVGVRVNIEDMIYSLKSLMWRQMGVERTRAGIEDALAKITFWSRALAELGSSDVRALELTNMLTVAQVSALGALSRQESRGVHFRSDFKETRPDWRVHTVIRPILSDERIEEFELSHAPVGGTKFPR